MSIALEVKVQDLEKAVEALKKLLLADGVRITGLEARIAGLIADLGGPPAKHSERRPNGSRA